MDEAVREWLAEQDEELLTADGFDEALVGVVHQFGRPPIACYDYQKCIDVLMRDGCTYEEAVEYFDYNVIGAYVGDSTPCFLEPVPAELTACRSMVGHGSDTTGTGVRLHPGGRFASINT